MKKIKLLLLTVIIVLGNSCSDNSDDLKTKDSIIGIWKPNKEIFILENGTEVTQQFNECFETNRFNFKENSSLDYTTYDDDGNGLCYDRKDMYELVSTKWEKLPNGKYTFTSTFLIKSSNQTETIMETNEISFLDDNFMRITNNAVDFFNGDKVEKAYLEYKRLN